MPYRRRTWTVH